MDRLDGIRAFLRVVEAGSFSAVAREPGAGQPAVSKQVTALERRLGVALVRRSSRSLSLTEAGEAYYQAAERLVAEFDEAESRIGRSRTHPAGVLRVAVSAGFGRLRVVPLLPEFCARYPELTIDLIVSDRFVDLVEDGIDVAVRLGELPDSGLMARRIGTSPRVTVATPDYLARAGVPATPGDLDRHACIGFTFRREPRVWVFDGPGGAVRHVPRGPVRANDAEHIRAATLAGLGLAQAPRWLFAEDLANGAVREILADYPAERSPIHAVYPGGRNPVSKVRLFVDHLATAWARGA